MLRVMLAGIVCLGLAGCDKLGFGRDAPTFDGQYFRGSAKVTDRKDRQQFTATVRQVSKSLDGAVAAAEHEGVKHCIRYFGTSEIDWEVGPDTPREALPVSNDTLTFRGRCIDK